MSMEGVIWAGMVLITAMLCAFLSVGLTDSRYVPVRRLMGQAAVFWMMVGSLAAVYVVAVAVLQILELVLG